MPRIDLVDEAGAVIAGIANQPGKQGTLAVYHYLKHVFDILDAQAAEHGVETTTRRNRQQTADIAHAGIRGTWPALTSARWQIAGRAGQKRVAAHLELVLMCWAETPGASKCKPGGPDHWGVKRVTS